MRPSSSQESAFWTKNRRGLHDDDKGFNVDLIAVPVGGRLVMRVRKEPPADHVWPAKV
ncbi:hypothetical protein [Bradyrhizobium sp. CCBAU 11445]|uniref:hypothetical protein n=1 Tax=Bradyrhizobium sp. CCBAU 11445 TaxID=1630896 RepID=UPI0023057CA9|nr:hypothetical protein [Bradyrhizobium sp. CCBAU 11445]